MTSATFRTLVVVGLAATLVGLLAPNASSQTLYSMDGGSGLVLEIDMKPGLACPPAVGRLVTWPYVNIVTCNPPGPPLNAPGAPPSLLGDVAVDRTTDIVFVTDGFHIEEFAAGNPTLPPGTPINSYSVPAIPVPGGGSMGGLTGMGFDPLGAFTAGQPTLWVTDGTFIAGLTPSPAPNACIPPAITFQAFHHGLAPTVFLSDVTWDPVSGTLWGCCSVCGVVFNINVGGGPGPAGSFPAGICGPLAGPLQGIAYDLASPGVAGFGTNAPVPALYVTDGTTVEYMELITGGPAQPTFYNANPCIAAPGAINGLAFASHGVKWGIPGGLAIGSYGQTSSPGPTFGLSMSGGTGGAALWIVYGVNAPTVPSGGYFCPPLPAFGPGVFLYADLFTPPGGFLYGGAVPASGNVTIPAPIPGALPAGVEFYIQFLEDVSTTGLGPWASSDPLLITLTRP